MNNDELANNMPQQNVPVNNQNTNEPAQNENQTNGTLAYDFNFENKTEGENLTVASSASVTGENVVIDSSVEQPSTVQVEPTPVSVQPEQIVVAGATVMAAPVTAGQEQQPVTPTPVSTVKTSGTVTEEELVIDATKKEPEVLDEYSLKMDEEAEKKKHKKNVTFISIVFGILIIFVLLLKVIITIVGY